MGFYGSRFAFKSQAPAEPGFHQESGASHSPRCLQRRCWHGDGQHRRYKQRGTRRAGTASWHGDGQHRRYVQRGIRRAAWHRKGGGTQSLANSVAFLPLTAANTRADEKEGQGKSKSCEKMRRCRLSFSQGKRELPPPGEVYQNEQAISPNSAASGVNNYTL